MIVKYVSYRKKRVFSRKNFQENKKMKFDVQLNKISNQKFRKMFYLIN